MNTPAVSGPAVVGDPSTRTASTLPVLEVRSLTKRFPGVIALNGVSLYLGKGEVLALMGENGAGKSTLMKILAGVMTPDEGEILLDGKPVSLRSVAAAKAFGIGIVHQELMLAPNLDIASNIFLGSERKRDVFGTLDERHMECRAKQLLEKVGLHIAPSTLTSTLTTGQMQMVETCKALRQEPRVLILDEPTSSLSLDETERLMALINEIRESGGSILYVSHRMGEVFRIADRILVLRDGRAVGGLDVRDAAPAKIVSMMIGRSLASWFPAHSSHAGEIVLSVDHIVMPNGPAEATFDARRGEIVGFAGLIGSGRTELMKVLAGIARPSSGSMVLDGKPYRPRSVSDAVRQGVYLVPEDRKLHGLVLAMNVTENISLPDLKKYRSCGKLNFKRERRAALDSVATLNIRPPNVDQKVVNLSGGNQQKVVLAKWLAMNPRLLILDEPTRGIDVGAKAECYAQIVALAERGISILFVSSDLEEIVGLSDRVVVMRNQRIVAVVERECISRDAIGHFMTIGESMQ